MSENAQDCHMPAPTPEHGLLQETVGTWDVDCTYFMGPGEPMRLKAREVVEPIGPFWTLCRFESEFGGQPYVGRATMGYDPKKGKWVGTWVDSMMPHLFVMEGDMDAETKVLTMHSEGIAPMSGEMVPYRSTIEHLADGGRRFEMFMTLPDAGEVQIFSYLYSRAE